jgi:hypothetical protein
MAIKAAVRGSVWIPTKWFSPGEYRVERVAWVRLLATWKKAWKPIASHPDP